MATVFVKRNIKDGVLVRKITVYSEQELLGARAFLMILTEEITRSLGDLPT